MKNILKGAKFGDKFVCRNGDIALYLWTNGKEGYSLQLEKEKKPHHYDVDGHWYAQADKENPYDVVSKVVINEDGTTSHLHSDSFLDKHPERRETPQFTEEEELEQSNFMVAMAKRL